MKKLIKGTLCAGIISLGLSANVEAALISGSGLIYDTDLDITWLADANYAFNSGYVDTITTNFDDGRMTWAQADTWVSQLDFAGSIDWRLPTASAPSTDSCTFSSDFNGITTYAYGCTNSEMGHLFHELGGTVDIVANTSMFDENIFSDLQHWNYWSGTTTGIGCDPAYPNVGCVWDFDFKNSVTYNYTVGANFYALAVHEGDIGNLAAVPVPPAVWLFGSGLIGLIGVSRRKLY